MRRRFSAEDLGDTLVEVLITVMILGITAAGLVGAMTTASAGSGNHQDEAYAQSLAVAAAEQLESTSTTYHSCAAASDYVSTAQTAYSAANLPAPWTSATIQVASVQYWTSTGWSTNVADCIDGSVPNGGLQKIQVQVTSPDQKAVESVWFIKRKP